MKALLLGQEAFKIAPLLNSKGHHTFCVTDPVTELAPYDIIISFGYRHIIPKALLDTATCDAFNVHISLLPLNRGAHPNFWAHYDGTPSGVTIHKLDAHIDTGPILDQQTVVFDNTDTTFEHTYNRLIARGHDMLEQNIHRIINRAYFLRPQIGRGTYHRTSDLPEHFSGWDSDIDTEIPRLLAIERAQNLRRKLIINQIEETRSRNNVNWMDILRLSFRNAPHDAEKIIARINADDIKISELFKQLGS
jgi:methionyl-tRNA formyltransferase